VKQGYACKQENLRNPDRHGGFEYCRLRAGGASRI
jgi:hypothetical protein